MSWTSAASRTTGRPAGAASTERSVWSHRSSPGDLVLGDPALRCQLRRDPGEQPGVAQAAADRPTAAPRRAACRARSRCARRRGGGRGRPWPGSRPASPASTPKPSVAARRTVRTIRRASSSKRSRGSPTARSRSGRDVAGPVVRVHQPGRIGRVGARAPRHRVAGQVAAGEVQLDRVAELDPMRAPEVGVVVVGAEGRDLVELAVVADRHRPEAVLVDRAGKQLEHRLRAARRRRGPSPRPGGPGPTSRNEPPTTYAAWPPAHRRREQLVDRGRDRRPRWPQVRPGSAAVSSDPGTGRSATPRCARRRGTA